MVISRRLAMSTFQFTLPRGERPAVQLAILAAVEVSIHAPAGGATPSHYNGQRNP